MAELSWWGDVDARLSQGDVLSDVPAGHVVHPPVFLRKGSVKKGTTAWFEAENACDHFLWKGKLTACVILSHSCDLDKKERSGRVVVAPARPIDSVPEDKQPPILAQERFSLLPLPYVPGLGTHYADLRSMLAITRTQADAATKHASMSEWGQKRLHAQLVSYFTRLGLEDAQGPR